MNDRIYMKKFYFNFDSCTRFFCFVEIVSFFYCKCFTLKNNRATKFKEIFVFFKIKFIHCLKFSSEHSLSIKRLNLNSWLIFKTRDLLLYLLA